MNGALSNKILQETIIFLIKKERFYAEILIRMNKKFSFETETIAVYVDSKGQINLIVNPWFFQGIENISERAEVLKHECEHVFRCHFDREKNLINDEKRNEGNVYDDRSLFNLAADRAINELLPGLPRKFKIFNSDGSSKLSKEGLPVETEPVNVENFKKLCGSNEVECGKSAEYYYSFLKQNKNKLDENNLSTVDDHDFAAKMQKNTTPEVVEYAVSKIIEEAFYACKDVGNTPRSAQLILQDLKKSKKDWRQELKIFSGSCSAPQAEETNKRRNRRYGLKYPGRRPINRTHIVVAVDSSGSIRDLELKAMWQEMKNISALGVKITVVECDSDIQSVYIFSAKSLPKIKGRGGTSFKPVFDLLNQAAFRKQYGRPDGLIYMTDGLDYGILARPKFPVLWALLPGCRNNLKYDWGKITEIEVEEC